MGCHISRTSSTEDIQKGSDKSSESQSTQKKLIPGSRIQGPELRNGNGNILQIAGKPIIEVESASQADFFRMLDDKINNGKGCESDTENQ